MLKRGKNLPILIAASLAMCLYSFDASAQGLDTSIDANTYWPAPGPGNYFGVRGAAIAPHLGVGFSLDLNYQHRPITLVNVDDSGDVRDAVEYQVTADFLWSLGLFNWVQIGIALPTVLAMDGVGASPISSGAELATTAIRDLRIDLKSRFIGRGENGIARPGFGLALAATLTVPTGDRDNFAGDQNVVGEPVLIADYTHQYFSVAANIGARLRAASRFADIEVGHQLSFGVAGAGYLVDGRLQLLAELYGLVGLTGTDTVNWPDEATQVEIQGNQTHLELRAGIGYVPDQERDITIRLGGAAGLTTDTPGVPQFRVLLQLQYQPQNRDSDNDGVLDRDDGCDDAAEDMDDFDDEDGCPDLDNDEDEIPDSSDQCPDDAEDIDEFQDEDGCPDYDNDSDEIPDDDDECPNEPEDMDENDDEDGCPDEDNDGDEVPDGQDRCPAEAEDMDNFEDTDGCPDLDNDSDEIPDGEDECPDDAEDRDDFEDDDGCPDLDNDGDGVLDADDTCADEAETINGVTDGDGCADRGTGVGQSDEGFTFRGRARFGRGSSDIPAALRAQLEQVAIHMRTAALSGRTLVITGLADGAGETDDNRTLARTRAEAVRAVMTELGTPEARTEIATGDLTRRPAGLQVQLTLRAAE